MKPKKPVLRSSPRNKILKEQQSKGAQDWHKKGHGDRTDDDEVEEVPEEIDAEEV